MPSNCFREMVFTGFLSFTIILMASFPITYCVKPSASELVKFLDEVPISIFPERTLLIPTPESPPLTGYVHLDVFPYMRWPMPEPPDIPMLNLQWLWY